MWSSSWLQRMSCLQKFSDQLQTWKGQLLQPTASGEAQQQRVSVGIPLTRKMCYAVGGVPYQITTAAIGVSLQIFLLDVVQLEAFYVSMILFVSRAWDAVSDPLVGYLVSRSRWTPIGKLAPWLLLSMPFAVLSYLLLWFVPPVSMSPSLRVVWFLTATCLFESLMSCYNVPYLSLNMFLGGDKRSRDSATAYRMSVEMMAMLLASVIQGQVVAVYNTEKQEACQEPVPSDTTQSLSPPLSTSLQETQKAFLTSALVLGALFFLCSLLLFLGVKEQHAPVSHDQVHPSYLTSLKMLICHVPYQRLVLGFLFSAFAFQMSLGNFALFCSHAAGLGAQFQHLLLVLLASASIAVPIWQVVLLRIGKKATVFIGLSLFIPALLVIACIPSNLPVLVTMCVLMGFSVATMFLLPWSMLPDVVDDFTSKHPSCKDLEPMFFSCYTFSSKLAGGLSAGLSMMTLQFVGYRAGACHHGDGVVTALIVLFSPVPVALLLIGMVFFWSYPINERESLTDKLAADHPEALSSSSPTSSDHRRHAAQPHTRTSDSNTKSNPSPGSFDHDVKCSVRSSVTSNISKSHSGNDSSSKSGVRPNINHQRRERRLNSHLHPDEAQTSSRRSNKRSKVSWV
ncbi:sodium-dependent lysophosphatidylcholine symporter 1-B-like [Aulostomus maculatus]